MPSINYFRDIPNGPNDPSDDQPLMQINTNAIDEIFEVDHYTFGTNGNLDGWHRLSTYPKWPGAPTFPVDPPTLAGQGVVYTKDVGGGVIQLFYRRELNGPIIQLTTLGMVTNTPQAFVNFDGTVAGLNAAQTIRGSFNVASVTRIGIATGRYQVNFTTALPSANYTVVVTGQRSGIGSGFVMGAINDAVYATAVTTTAVQIAFSSQGTNLHDVNMGNVLIFGG